MKLNLGATLFAGGSGTAIAALFTLSLPEGYVCRETAAVEDSLSLFKTRLPQGKGTVEKPEMWSFSGNNECSFGLSGYDVIYSGSSIMIKIVVDNPPSPVGQASSSNRWRVTIASRGYNPQANQLYIVEGSVFMSAQPEVFFGSLPVLGKLRTAVIAPADFSVSTTSILRHNWMSLWFHTEQSAGQNGYILINAPRHFNFGKACRVENLEEEYYVSGGDTTAYPLTAVLSCDGLAEATDRPNLQGRTSITATTASR